MDIWRLVQALGLSFTVSTVVPAVNVAAVRALGAVAGGTTAVALSLACAGMWLGQVARLRMTPAVFQRWFFLGLLALGAYLMGRSGWRRRRVSSRFLYSMRRVECEVRCPEMPGHSTSSAPASR
jgi:hypothetical protein